MTKDSWKLSRVGDSAVVVEFAQCIEPEVNAHAISVAEAIRGSGYRGVRDVVESYCAVTVHFDPLKADVVEVVNGLEAAVRRHDGAIESGRQITLPVCYGGEHGPDLSAVACFAGCTETDVIAKHSAVVYRVYMLGFLPGFAYLGSVDQQIAMPRRKTPRVRVPHGSVGIASYQTGVYPVEAPGGWQLIGRSPVKPFDLRRSDPFLFQAGDTVRFESINREEFNCLTSEA